MTPEQKYLRTQKEQNAFSEGGKDKKSVFPPDNQTGPLMRQHFLVWVVNSSLLGSEALTEAIPEDVYPSVMLSIIACPNISGPASEHLER